MYPELLQTIKLLKKQRISEDRKAILIPLIEFIQKRLKDNKGININFICTHNSRRSHLSQVWAQTASVYYTIPNVSCYSGGTEETEIFPKIIETLQKQGFLISKLSSNENPIYSIKYDESLHPVIGFSKKYDHPINPDNNFIAVMTCSQADTNCPFIVGADQRISITYEDPKISDGTSEQNSIYSERSLEIGAEMFYVFSQVKNSNLIH